ncbi:MAG: ABC transporter permease [Acidimicrobiales bacterium]
MAPEEAESRRGERRTRWEQFLFSWFALPGSLLAALLLGALMMVLLNANPLTGYHALFDGAFVGNYALGASAVRAAPLLLVAVGICISFRANLFNIGGEGQLAMGGLASAATALTLPNLPSIVLIPLVLLAGAAAGAIWGAIPGAFKAYYNVNEILSTIMLNLVAVQVMNYLLAGPMVDTTQNSTYGLIPETRLLPHNSWLPILIRGTQLHLGVAIAIVMALAAYVLLWHTSLGFRLRAVGLSREAATYAGIKVRRTQVLAMTLSGAMCGLGGALLVFGSISHRMVTDGSLTGFTGSDGFNGIVVALFGGLSPLWSVLSAFLFGGLLTGGDALQVATGVPADMVTTLEGLVVIFVVSLEYGRRRARVGALIPRTTKATGSPPGDEAERSLVAAGHVAGRAPSDAGQTGGES